MANRFSVEAVFRAVDRLSAPVTRMQNRVGRFTRSVTRGFNTANRSVDRVTGAMVRGSTSVVAGLGVAAATLGTVVTLFNKSSVEAEQLANSVGFNVNKLEALAGAVAPAGFQLDNVVDLIEEMNNKLGESAGLGETITPVTESLAILGLRFKDIADLSPEKQFGAIANAALKMEDAQKAAAAADILLGGEANKIIGVLRQQGGTLEDIITQQEKLNFRTEESRRGAEAFVRQMGLTTRGVNSLGAEISGLAGKHLAPLLAKLTDWAAANKQIIADRVVSAATSISEAIKFLIENLETVTLWIKRVGVGLAVFIAFSTILKTLILIMTAVSLVMAASPIMLIILGIMALIAVIAAAIIWWDEIKKSIIAFGRAVVDKVLNVFQRLRDAFKSLPIDGAISWLIGAAAAVMESWEPIKIFFSDLWGEVVDIFNVAINKIAAAVDRVKNVASSIKGLISGVGTGVVDFFGFGGDAGEQKPRVVSPGERAAQSIEERRTTSAAEVTIRDETGRAEVTSGILGPGLVLQPSGGF